MTATKEKPSRLLAFGLIFLILLFIVFSSRVANGVKEAISLCARVIFPTLFPFMVLSDLFFCRIGNLTLPPALEKISRRLFRLPAVGLLPFLFGALCGFPIGAKCLTNLRENRSLTNAEGDRCLAFCNNTGPAFVIAGVGCGLFGSQVIGLLLYFSQILAAILTGILFARLPDRPQSNTAHEKEKGEVFCDKAYGNFPDTVRRSMENTLAVCGMVLFFSGITSLLGVFLESPTLLAFISSFLEVGNGAAGAAALFATMPRTALLAAGISISFGGISVHMQAAFFVKECGVSMRRYLAAKAVQAAVASLLLFLSSFFVFSV